MKDFINDGPIEEDEWTDQSDDRKKMRKNSRIIRVRGSSVESNNVSRTQKKYISSSVKRKVTYQRFHMISDF